MHFYSPIVLFIYKRPLHLAKTLKSLSFCEGFQNHPIYVFGDGPRNENENSLVQETRNIAMSFLGDKAQYIFSNKNKGLANSVIDGVTNIITKYQSVIVIEDDLVFHSQFLKYMNNALIFFANNSNVMSISGYMYKTESLFGSNKAVLLPMISTWGWGTWSRAWSNFDTDSNGAEDLKLDKLLKRSFDCNNSYPFSRMLELQRSGRIDSWGIRWYWTIFKKKGLACFPPITLVENNGFDKFATHGKGLFTKFRDNKTLNSAEINVDLLFKEKNEFKPEIYNEVCKSLYRLNGGHLGKIRDIIKNISSRNILH
jgi:hypothetical protein